MNAGRPTVYVVDDDASFLQAVTRLLVASGFTVQAFDSARAFLDGRPADARGCVVVDLNMPGVDGLELQATLQASDNPLSVLFLTGQGDIASTVRAMRAGAEDFIEKRAPREALLDAVRRALTRDARVHAAEASIQATRRRFAGLSKRELEVLSLVVAGKLNKQIAAELGIGERTVKLHRHAITSKSGIRSTAMLTRLAQEARLFEPSALDGDATFPKVQ